MAQKSQAFAHCLPVFCETGVGGVEVEVWCRGVGWRRRCGWVRRLACVGYGGFCAASMADQGR